MKKERSIRGEVQREARPSTVSPSEDNERFASVQYLGLPGISQECRDAVLRLVQYGDQITRARILSADGDHCLLLSVGVAEDIIAVKSGFSSGYLGEGPRCFSYVLEVLQAHGIEIEEYRVSADLIERLDRSILTQADLEKVNDARAVRPTRWHDYILYRESSDWQENLWREFPAVIPFAIVDNRLKDLAITFWDRADERLLTPYRRSEDIVRTRTGIDEHGADGVPASQSSLPTGGESSEVEVSETTLPTP